jgi:hypothetical protein
VVLERQQPGLPKGELWKMLEEEGYKPFDIQYELQSIEKKTEQGESYPVRMMRVGGKLYYLAEPLEYYGSHMGEEEE